MKAFILVTGQVMVYTDEQFSDLTWTDPCGCLMSAGEDGDFCLIECWWHRTAREFHEMCEKASPARTEEK